MKSQPRRREALLSLSHSLSLCLVRPVTFDADGAVFTGKGKKKTWQVSSARHEDRWRGEHAEFGSALCVAFFSAENCQVSWWSGKKKTLIRPSRRSVGIKNETSIPGLNRGFFFSARPERLRMSTVSYVAKY